MMDKFESQVQQNRLRRYPHKIKGLSPVFVVVVLVPRTFGNRDF